MINFLRKINALVRISCLASQTARFCFVGLSPALLIKCWPEKSPTSLGIPGDLLATESLTSDVPGYSLTSGPKLALRQSHDWQKNLSLKVVEFNLKSFILIFSKKIYIGYVDVSLKDAWLNLTLRKFVVDSTNISWLGIEPRLPFQVSFH